MNDINEIKKQLDELYKDYRAHKNSLSKEKTNIVINCLITLTFNKDSKESDIAKELSRFSYFVCCRYFESLSKATSTNIDIIDSVIGEMMTLDNDKSKAPHYARKYSMTLDNLINYSNTNIFKSKMAPKLVLYIVKASKTDNQKNDFIKLIDKTDGNIYRLNYSVVDHSTLYDLYKLTKELYPDMMKCKYVSEISEWAAKYEFTINSQENKIIENNTVIKPSILEKNEEPIETKKPNINETSKINKENPSTAAMSDKSSAITKEDIGKSRKEDDVNSDKDIVAVKFDNSEVLSLISGEGRKTRELVSKEFTSLQYLMNSFKADLSKNIEVANTNAILQRKIEKLESELDTVKQANASQRVALEQLTKEKSEIEIKASEFEEQLRKAFDLNNRETENKADKVKFDILNSVKLSYENWTEYENAECSEDNYESLKAIIKAIFRGLERNGINVKGID